MGTHIGLFKYGTASAAACIGLTFTTITKDNNEFDVEGDTNFSEIDKFWLKPDGTAVYFTLNLSERTVFQYSMSTAFDISGATYVRELDVASDFLIDSNQLNPDFIMFSDNGEHMYIWEINYMVDYTLTTAWDISTATKDNHTAFSAWGGSAVGRAGPMALKDDGTGGLLLDSSGNDLNEFTLSTAYDMTTLSVGGTVSYPTDFNVENRTMFTCDGTAVLSPGNANIKIYELTTAWDINSIGTTKATVNFSFTGEFTRSLVNFQVVGDKLYVLGSDAAGAPTGFRIERFTLS